MARSNKDQPKKLDLTVKKEFHETTQWGDTRIDPYHWIRGKNPDDWQALMHDASKLDPEIRDHLLVENAHFEQQAKGFANYQNDIATELDSRLDETDSTVPVKNGDWEYWRKFKAGGNYPTYMRRHIDSGKEQVIVDGEIEKKSSPFFSLLKISVSPDQKYAAYLCDRSGSENFEIRIRDIESGKDLDDMVIKSGRGIVWSSDSSMIYYLENNDNHRADRVKSHIIGQKSDTDKTVYVEADSQYSLSIEASQSKGFLFINSQATHQTEVRYLPLTGAVSDEAPKVIKPRGDKEKYYVAHNGAHFYIRTDRDGAENFKIMRAPIDDYAANNWEDFIAYDPNASIEEFVSYKDYMLRAERYDGRLRIVIADYTGKEVIAAFDQPAFSAELVEMHEYDTSKVLVDYSSLTCPGIFYELDLASGNKVAVKEKPLPDGFDPNQYIVEHFNILARDSTEVPVTILRHKSTKLDGSSPLYQYGYGSYGAAMDPYYRSAAISLADRGVIYAIANIRGGGEKGQSWHKGGQKDKKLNSFTDFIDVTEALTDREYGRKGEVFMEGVSAGGLLVGGVMNMRPDLYAGVYAGVPFVDALTTISDPSLPLTPGEWEEWGNPIKDKATYHYMKKYSPYDNIHCGVEYPAVFANAGLTDFRVTYWEPAKWIARLRDEAEGGPFMLHTDMNAGHGGSNARYERNQQQAQRYAFACSIFEGLGYDMALKQSDNSASCLKSRKPDHKP